MTRSPMLIGGILLGLFGVAGATLVSLTHVATADRIERNEREALMRQIRNLVPPSSIDNDILKDTTSVEAPDDLGVAQTTVYRARKSGEPVALILSPVVAQGYNGSIKLIVGVNNNLELAGVRVLTHRETPGLGDKIEENRSDWILTFAGRSLTDPKPENWKVKRDGGYFDQLTGATITPRAIVKATKQALEYVKARQENLYAAASPKEKSS